MSSGGALEARSLTGYHVRTPYGWGVCSRDDVASPHVEVALRWRLRTRAQPVCFVRRDEIFEQSFCAVGQCVRTVFGTGVVLGFRPEDGTHHVQLWGPLGRGRNYAYLNAAALLELIPAAVGLAVETPFGAGVCRGYRMPHAGGGSTDHLNAAMLVDLPWGRAILQPSQVECPVAVVLPLVERFLVEAAGLLRLHSGTLSSLREAFAGMGLERMQEQLVASAGEVAEAAGKMWEDFEQKDAMTVVDDLRLKADEVFADPEMQSAFQTGIHRLNQLVCQSEGFDGVWVGKDDLASRCVIRDAVIKWHWGEDSELEIWGNAEVSTDLAGDIFRATLTEAHELVWTDGDTWVLSEPREDGALSPGGRTGAHEDAVGKDDIDLIKRSLAELRRVVGGRADGLEGDVEEVLGALSRVASGDGEVQRVVDVARQRHKDLLELRGEVLESRTGRVLQDGQDRIQAQLLRLQETDINPQLERVHLRSSRFVTRLATDRGMKSKAMEFFQAAQSRVAEKLCNPEDPSRAGLEAWASSAKDSIVGQLNAHRGMLVESLEGLDLQQLDARQLLAHSWDPVALEAQLGQSLVRAIKISGVPCCGTELLERFESSEPVSRLPALQQTYQGILARLDNLEVQVPAPIRQLLEAQAAGQGLSAEAMRRALVDSLDDDRVVSGASELVKRGEQVLAQVQEMKSSLTFVQVMEHLENEEIEHQLLRSLHGLDPQRMLRDAERALGDAQTREELLSSMKDVCLDFVLRVLPAISIEKLGGTDNGCEWEINDISFSDFRFRKENVQLTMGDAACFGDEVLHMSVWDISAHFKQLKVTVKQQTFPFIETDGIADARAERMSVDLAFKLEEGEEGAPKRLAVSSRSVHMEDLELWVCETNYAVVINALSFLFADALKEYACEKICGHLDAHVGPLVETLNDAMSSCAPMLAKLGLALPTPTAEGPSEIAVLSLTKSGRLEGRASFIEEIEWADPGRTFAVRV